MTWRNRFAWLDPRNWLHLPDVTGVALLPARRQLFISKSGSRQDSDHWITMIRSAAGAHFNLMWDDQFRVIGGEDHRDHWRKQFDFTRASYAMVVLMDPAEWVSRGQEIEGEDALGRRIPLAMCRVEPFESQGNNDLFLRLTRGPEEKARYRFIRYFDLAGADVDTQLARMTRWLRQVACAPPELPFCFDAGRAKDIRAVIRIPDGDRWRAMDWGAHRPQLVANYGSHFAQLGTSVPYGSRPQQLVFDVNTSGGAGEIRATVTLPSAGVGHMALTIGEPQPSYAYDDGGLMADRSRDLLLWWDFVVAASR
jgi:hypothetical protein